MDRSKKSICYMSLADAFLTRLRKEAEVRTRNRMLKGVGVEVVPVTTDRRDFMYDYLMNLYKKKKGTFNKSKVFSKQTIYECERSNNCRGNSTGDPTKTRANGCSAYVSFMFEEGATITACVVRFRLTHNGHDPTNREESRVSRIDPSLKFIIEMHISNGIKISGIMSEIAKWNKLQKNMDHHNRRFFPTRQDIQQLALSMKKPLKSLSDMGPRKYDLGSKDHVSRLVRVELRDSCLYHQSRTTTAPNARPLIVVLQNRTMRETLALHGRHLIFVDKNYEGLRQYGNAVYVLVARDEGGGGGPVAYIVTSDDSVVTFVQALQKLSVRSKLSPRAFFLDREIHKFSEVMSAIFPESQFFTSWCSVMQDVHQWLQSSEVSGKNHADIRRVLMHYVLELKVHDTEGWFLLAASETQERIEYDKFTAMLQTEWLSCATKWSDFGRLGMCGSQEAGAALEMFFQRLQHQYLKGVHTKKSLEDLIRLLTDNMNDHKSGGPSVSQPVERTVREQAEELVREGRSQLLMTWQGEMVALVGSHTQSHTHTSSQTDTSQRGDTSYRVALVTMECECPGPASEGPCLHLCLALTVAQSVEGHTPHQERHRLASEAYENSDYLMDGTFCMTFHSGGSMCVLELATGECSCLASAFGVECVGKILLKIANGSEEAVTYTVPTDTDTATDTTALLAVPSPIESSAVGSNSNSVGNIISENRNSVRTAGVESSLIENIAMESIDVESSAMSSSILETSSVGSIISIENSGLDGLVSCVPWTPDNDKTTAQSITITLTEEEEEEEKKNLTHHLRPLVGEDSFQVIHGEKPAAFVIQTQTGIKDEPSTVTRDPKKSDAALEDVIVVGDVGIIDDIKKELVYPITINISSSTNTTTTTTTTSSKNNINRNNNMKSSKRMIEDLYRWSKSEEFVDSKDLKNLLKEAHNLVFLAREYSPISARESIASRGRKSHIVGNKNLRAVVRAVKRGRNVSEQEEEEQRCVLPPMKVSRSGRTIRIKEEPDFVT